MHLFFLLIVVLPQTIEGRVTLGDRQLPCDMCPVTLVISRGAKIRTYTDNAGRFAFRQVVPGLHRLRVEVDGYEEFDEETEVRDVTWSSDLTVNLVRSRQPRAVTGGQVVDVSDFLQHHPKTAQTAFQKGFAKRIEGKFEEALKLLRRAVEIAPNFYEAHNEIGLTCVAMGKLDIAEVAFKRASELNSSRADAHINLAGVYITQGKPHSAITAGREAVKRNPLSPSAFTNLGIALYKVQDFAGAEDALSRAMRLGTNVPEVRLLLADIYIRTEEYEGAVLQLDAYLAENPHGEHRDVVEQTRDKVNAYLATIH